MVDHIENPILPGFNPDPSICRVGDDYYIATSTFEWFPGVQIHHSRNLIDWTLVARPLNRKNQLDMLGCPDSCGVWAPCLTWDKGVFYLVYTNVRRFDGNFKDTPNFLVTSESIEGDWSDPIYLNSSGFDPSLFHDDDGRKYLVNMIWDHRPGHSRFGGIALQEYSVDKKALIGSVKNIFSGSVSGLTEGPHLYKLDGMYYLLTAEGGTGYDHGMTFARSKTLLGPYKVDPIVHFVTARDHPENLLQRTGHGDIVQTPEGGWYAVHLCSRPLSLHGGHARRSPMGRETAIQKLKRDRDGWFRLSHDTVLAEENVLAPLPGTIKPVKTYPVRYFDQIQLADEFQWLRVADPGVFMSLTDRSGYLRLYGKESLGSLYHSALLARRQEHFQFQAITYLEFDPQNFQQMAGLVCYYNSHKFHYVYVSLDERIGKHLGVMSCLGDLSLEAHFPIHNKEIALSGDGVYLRASVDFDELVFAWSHDGVAWHDIGQPLDYSLLSDEAGKGEGANFTGAFVGMCCQDISGTHLPADFKFFHYDPKEDNAN